MRAYCWMLIHDKSDSLASRRLPCLAVRSAWRSPLSHAASTAINTGERFALGHRQAAVHDEGLASRPRGFRTQPPHRRCHLFGRTATSHRVYCFDGLCDVRIRVGEARVEIRADGAGAYRVAPHALL